jgi:hypothetical protein
MSSRLFFWLLFLPVAVAGQKTCRLTGYVQDAASGERLIGATIYSPVTKNGTTTNTYGYFSLNVETGNSCLQVNFVGYESQTVTLSLHADSLVYFNLKPGLELDEVQISAIASQSNPGLSSLSYNRLTPERIKKLPAFLGETDVLKAIQYLPGVKGGRENTANYNVRGGSGDQNLILLDGAPVYNIYHAFGFFSTFNSQAVKDVAFYKGGIPARYGGRLASVLDVTTREGNMKKAGGVFSISPVSSQLNYEAPVKQDTASFLVAFRRSFADLPMRAIQKISGSDQTFGYNFYDLNAKANWIVNPRNRLFLSLYTGRDRQFYRSADSGESIRSHYQWGNFTGVLRWNRLLGAKCFANFIAYASQYRYEQYSKSELENDFTRFKTFSKLWDYSLKADLEYYPVAYYTLRIGGQVSYLTFAPGIFQVQSNDFSVDYNQENRNKAGLVVIYAENQFRLGRFDLNAGLRLSGYVHQGQTYFYAQPRLALAVNLGQDYSLSASYMELGQYLHLLTNSSMGLPTDLWVGATARIKPQTGRQFSLGLEKKISNMLRAGVEAYYKDMDHVIRFKEGETFIDTKGDSWENAVVSGRGRAYGAELFVEKQTGRLTGMLSYTLSKSERLFDGVNDDQWFPFKYDRRHDLSLNGEYRLPAPSGKERSFSLGFTLQSGNHLSIADSEQSGVVLPGMEPGDWIGNWFLTRRTYDRPNNFKMPVFHHLDLGYTSTKKLRNGRNRTWSFSVYNVYSRLNAWYYYKKKGEVRKVSIFPVVPSVSYTFSW